jgi:type I restriction enzyme S subunit
VKVRLAAIGDILDEDTNREAVRPGIDYPNAGVLNRGRGLFEKPDLSSARTNYDRLSRLARGQVVYSRLFGWEGAVAIVPAEFEGRYVSLEFPHFDVNPEVSVHFLGHYLTSPPFLAQIALQGSGLGQRRQRVTVDRFLRLPVPIPGREDQDRIVAHLDRLAEVEAEARTRQGAGSIAVGRSGMAILPRALGDALRGLDLPTVPLGELCRNSHRVVRPGEPLLGAESFVGLEHIEPHTGRRISSRPVADETGRKILFTPGTVTYGYLRPYLNKVWVADRTGLCSVEQYVLTPADGVDPELFGALLRSDLVLTPAKEATNGLQLPRLSSSVLLGLRVPDIRNLARLSEILTKMHALTDLVSRIAQASDQRNELIDAVLPAARNEIFTELMARATS